MQCYLYTQLHSISHYIQWYYKTKCGLISLQRAILYAHRHNISIGIIYIQIWPLDCKILELAN